MRPFEGLAFLISAMRPNWPAARFSSRAVRKPRGAAASRARAFTSSSGRRIRAAAISSRLYVSIFFSTSAIESLAVRHLDEFFEPVHGLSLVHRSSREGHALLQRSDGTSDNQRAGGIQQGYVAIGIPGAGKNLAQRVCIVRGIAALEFFRRGTPQAYFFRGDLEQAYAAALDGGDLGHACRRHLVESVTVHDPDRFRAQPLEHMRDRLHPIRRKNPDELFFDTGRIGERSEQVEDRARAELHPGGANVTHRSVMIGREHEADARFGNAGCDALGAD